MISHALQLRRDRGGGHDHPQVARYGLLARDQKQARLFDGGGCAVDRHIIGDHLSGKLLIAFCECLNCALLGIGNTSTKTQQRLLQLVQFGVKGGTWHA